MKIPRTKKGLAAYIFAIFMVTFSIFQTSNTAVPKKTVHAPSPAPVTAPVLGVTSNNMYQVTRVVDGDTIQIDTGQKVRLIGVDTPETVAPRKAVQCFGKEASTYTSERLLGQTVRLEKDVSETDSFGRLLRYVYVGDEFFNNTLVTEGYAHAVTFPPDISKQGELKNSELTARFNKKGLWGAVCTKN